MNWYMKVGPISLYSSLFCPKTTVLYLSRLLCLFAKETSWTYLLAQSVSRRSSMPRTVSLVPPRDFGLTILKSLGYWTRCMSPSPVTTQTCAFSGRHSVAALRDSLAFRGESPLKPPNKSCHLILSFVRLLSRSNTICTCRLKMPKEAFSKLLLTTNQLPKLSLLFQLIVNAVRFMAIRELWEPCQSNFTLPFFLSCFCWHPDRTAQSARWVRDMAQKVFWWRVANKANWLKRLLTHSKTLSRICAYIDIIKFARSLNPLTPSFAGEVFSNIGANRDSLGSARFPRPGRSPATHTSWLDSSLHGLWTSRVEDKALIRGKSSTDSYCILKTRHLNPAHCTNGVFRTRCRTTHTCSILFFASPIHVRCSQAFTYLYLSRFSSK